MARKRVAANLLECLLVSFSVGLQSGHCLAAESDVASREARRQEAELRREQALARRDMEARSRAQTDALRAQEDAIQRLESTRMRIEDNSQQIALQSAELARTTSYPNLAQGLQPMPVSLQALAGQEVGTALPKSLARTDVAIARPNDRIDAMVLNPVSVHLGAYFGARNGVLVVRAGADAPFGLEDGDVVLSVDGRRPVDGEHLMGILRSYRPGEHLKLKLLRQGREIKVGIEVTSPADF